MDRNDFLEPSLSPGDNGELIGKRPKTVDPAKLREQFPAQRWPKAVRAKCLDCCCGNAAEVTKCVDLDCPLWPYRFGINPFSGRRGQQKPGLKSEPVEMGLDT
jgi:hypothetical protein